MGTPKDWKEDYLKNPIIKGIIIFVGVIGGLLILIQFYNILPIPQENFESIVMTLKINIMLTILLIVIMFTTLWERMIK